MRKDDDIRNRGSPSFGKQVASNISLLNHKQNENVFLHKKQFSNHLACLPQMQNCVKSFEQLSALKSVLLMQRNLLNIEFESRKLIEAIKTVTFDSLIASPHKFNTFVIKVGDKVISFSDQTSFLINLLNNMGDSFKTCLTKRLFLCTLRQHSTFKVLSMYISSILCNTIKLCDIILKLRATISDQQKINLFSLTSLICHCDSLINSLNNIVKAMSTILPFSVNLDKGCINVNVFIASIALMRANQLEKSVINGYLKASYKYKVHETDTNNRTEIKYLKRYYTKLLSEEKLFFDQIFLEVCECNSILLKNDLKSLLKYSNGYKLKQFAKEIAWDAHIGPLQKEQLHILYVNTLWSCVQKHIKRCYTVRVVSQSYNVVMVTSNDTNMIEREQECMSTCIKKFQKDTSISNTFIECLKALLLHTGCFHNSQQWDGAMCSTMNILLKDRFRYVNKDSSVKTHSQTINSCLNTHRLVQNFFRRKRALCGHHNHSLNRTITSQWLTLATFVCHCLHYKRLQFLSSASWDSFFVSSLIDIKSVKQELTPLMVQLKPTNDDDSEEYVGVDAEKLVIKLNHIQVFEEITFKMVQTAMKYRSRAAWEQHMPNRKSWRRRGSSVQAYEHSAYIPLVIQLIFSPLIQSLPCLLSDDAMKVLLLTVTEFVREWMEYLLYENIKFSWFGSQQLAVDFRYFKQWFEQEQFAFSLDELDMLYSLPILDDMQKVIFLISCQPSKLKNREDSTFSSHSTISQVSTEQVADNHFHEAITAIDIPEKERWLSLRVKGGKSKSTFFCL